MALSLRWETSGTCRALLACYFLLALGSSALAQSLPEERRSKPIFVVRATNNLEPEVAEVLDAKELERLFVELLQELRIDNVSSGAVPPASAGNVYILNVAAESLYLADRERWNEEEGRFEPCTVLGAEMSLSLEDAQAGRRLDLFHERSAFLFRDKADAKLVAAQMGAMQVVTEDLAERFVDELRAGAYGTELAAAYRPTEFDVLLSKLTGSAASGIAATGLSHHEAAVAVILAASIFLTLALFIRSVGHRRARLHEHFRQLVERALTLRLQTDNFSEDACHAAAAAKREQLLAGHAEIEKRAAGRLREAHSLGVSHKKAAKYAGREAALEQVELIKTLRNAEEWEYRVLQEAKRQALEGILA
jgi:hypothetical protein